MQITRVTFDLLPVLLLAGCAAATPSAPDAASPPAATVADEDPVAESSVPSVGSVLATDSALGIHLISIGHEYGVRTGDEFTIFRGNRFVAVIVVDKVFKDRASVTVKKINGKAMLKSEIMVGDKVASAL